MTLTRYVPRNLRDDGMIEAKEVEHYSHLNLQQYIKADEVRELVKECSSHIQFLQALYCGQRCEGANHTIHCTEFSDLLTRVQEMGQ